MRLGSYRGRFDIMADILRVVSSEPKKTHIMNQANLSYSELQRYLSKLIKTSLISFKSAENSYVLTQKGHEFLNKYRQYLIANKKLKEQLDKVCAKRGMLEGLCPKK